MSEAEAEAEEANGGASEVDKDQLESLLTSDLLGINDLRDIIDDRDLNTTARRTDKLVSAILADKWDSNEFEELKEELAAKQEETGPKGYYIQSITSIDRLTDRPLHEEIQERLKRDEAVIEGNTVVEDGFELTNVEEGLVEGVHWSQNTTYVLGPFNQLRSRESLYDTEFQIDLENDLVFIGAERFGKARGFSSELREKSIELDPVGHHHLNSDDANDLVDDFVDDLKSSLRSESDNEQSGMEEFSDSDTSDLDSPVKIDTVNVQIESGEIKEVRVGGRADIFGVETVENLRENRDGKISQIKGEILFDDEFFHFNVGYNQITGRVMVRKKGRARGRVSVVQDAYDLLYDLYSEYFIDV